MRTLPYYPPYHGIFARRRHFLCGEEPLPAQEILTCVKDLTPLTETIGEVDSRYVDRCEEVLSRLPAQLRYLFTDYGWHLASNSCSMREIKCSLSLGKLQQ